MTTVSLADLIFYNDIYCGDEVVCRCIDCGGEYCSVDLLTPPMLLEVVVVILVQ